MGLVDCADVTVAVSSTRMAAGSFRETDLLRPSGRLKFSCPY